MVKVGFVSVLNPFDRNQFSGTLYYMYQALKRRPEVEVEVLGRKCFASSSLASKLFRLCNHGRVAANPFFRKTSLAILSRHVQADLERLGDDLDIIVAPAASKMIAALRMRDNWPPIFLVTDATPDFIKQHYFMTLGKDMVKCENLAIHRSAKVIYSSDYMAQRAREEFSEALGGSADEKLEVIPFGLNMDVLPSPEKPKRIDGGPNFLFVGKWWERKGGDVAVNMIEKLSMRGIPAHLTVLGCRPTGIEAENIEVIPYLNKNIDAEQEKYIELLRKTHFLVLPTRADCTPMVIAEANAFGIPVLVTNVGGIPSLVEEGVNGFLFSPDDEGEKYANKVVELIENPKRYEALSISSRKVYEDRLNWDAWARSIVAVASQVQCVPQSNVVRSYV